MRSRARRNVQASSNPAGETTTARQDSMLNSLRYGNRGTEGEEQCRDGVQEGERVSRGVRQVAI